jgi:hypothetical protein
MTQINSDKLKRKSVFICVNLWFHTVVNFVGIFKY